MAVDAFVRIKKLKSNGWSFSYSIQSGHLSLKAKVSDPRLFDMPGVWGSTYTLSKGVGVEKILSSSDELDKFLDLFLKEVEDKDCKLKEFFYSISRVEEYLEMVGFKPTK